ncbi:MAG TPA: adenosine deaminase [Anaerolineaceae bacterium]
MGWYSQYAVHVEPYRFFPKVDLHRHLEGSLRLETLQEIALQYPALLPPPHSLPAMVQINRDEAFSDKTFLSKFLTLRLFYQSPEIIQRVTREAIQDAAIDGIIYLELRFTPAALARARGFAIPEVSRWVAEAAQQASLETQLPVRLIASINRHESLAIASAVVQSAVDLIKMGIVGLDLAGNEAEFSALPFEGLFTEARQAGLMITAHGGEWGGSQNVKDAILALGAARVGHGVRVLEDPMTVALARERGAVFEVCITSNLQSGVVANLSSHPIAQMIESGLAVTLCTDDPGISQITLSDDYYVACDLLGMSKEGLKDRVRVAARGAFLPPTERDILSQHINQLLEKV